MADWAKPTITSNYVVFVDEIKNRDIDAITLQANVVTNPPIGAIKLLRTPTMFQEWNGTAFVNKYISIAGGGTGADNAPSARNNLGLGTMAVQNSNAIAVTGGTVANLTSSGSLSHNGSTVNISATSAGPALLVGGIAGNYSMQIVGALGLYCQAGMATGQYNLVCVNQNLTRHGLLVDGDMVAYLPWRLVIPVGANAYA